MGADYLRSIMTNLKRVKTEQVAGEARGSALLPAAAGGCGHPGRGDRVRRQADEEAPTDDGRREGGGVRADESLLGRAQKESREVARRRLAAALR